MPLQPVTCHDRPACVYVQRRRGLVSDLDAIAAGIATDTLSRRSRGSARSRCRRMNGNIPAPLMGSTSDDDFSLTSQRGMISGRDLFEQHTGALSRLPTLRRLRWRPDASVATHRGSFSFFLAPDAGSIWPAISRRPSIGWAWSGTLCAPAADIESRSAAAHNAFCQKTIRARLAFRRRYSVQQIPCQPLFRFERVGAATGNYALQRL